MTELYHYGVLGMKWGQHRAKKYKEKAASDRKRANQASYDAGYFKNNKSPLAKKARVKAQYKANYYRNRASKYESKAKKLESRGRNYTASARKAIKNMSTGKAVAQSMLLGSYGAAVYNNARSKNVSKGKAVVTATLANWGNNLTLGALSRGAERNNRK